MLARLRCGQLPVAMALRLWFLLLVRCGCADRSASMGNAGHECVSGRGMGRTPPDGCKALVSQARANVSARVSAYAPVPMLTQPPVPMLAQLQQRLPRGDAWRYEPKLDGFRGLLWRRAGMAIQLLSRNVKDLSPWFPELVQAGMTFPPDTVWTGRSS